MKRFLCFLYLASLSGFAISNDQLYPTIDTIPYETILSLAQKKKLDSNVLIVIVKKDKLGPLNKLGVDANMIINPEIIKEVNIIQGDSAISKYGINGKNGVLELYMSLDEIAERLGIVQKFEAIKIASVNEKDNKIYEQVEVNAIFPGGSSEWNRFVEKYLDNNVPIKNNSPEGKYVVVIQFMIDKEGKISNIKALTNHGYGMEQEAIRIIKKSPDWTPAIQNGKIVSSLNKKAIVFSVSKNQ